MSYEKDRASEASERAVRASGMHVKKLCSRGSAFWASPPSHCERAVEHRASRYGRVRAIMTTAIEYINSAEVRPSEEASTDGCLTKPRCSAVEQRRAPNGTNLASMLHFAEHPLHSWPHADHFLFRLLFSVTKCSWPPYTPSSTLSNSSVPISSAKVNATT